MLSLSVLLSTIDTVNTPQLEVAAVVVKLRSIYLAFGEETCRQESSMDHQIITDDLFLSFFLSLFNHLAVVGIV